MLYVNICGPYSNLYICQYCDSCKLIHLVLEQFIPRNYLAACLGSAHGSVCYTHLNRAIKTTEGHLSYALHEKYIVKKKKKKDVLQIPKFHHRSATCIYS